MDVFKDIVPFGTWRGGVSGAVAFVPTMGALHEGHLALCRRARELAPTVVVSIYVNPLQFGPQEDFSAYPRTLHSDLKLLEAQHVDAVLAPSQLGEAVTDVLVKAGTMSDELCGASRPGHFDGVLTVLTKFFNIVRPDVVVMGRKDYQQCAIVKRWVSGMFVSTRIEIHPIVRHKNGLAMSSRNARLSQDGLMLATQLYEGLKLANSTFLDGQDNSSILIKTARQRMRDVQVEYLEVRDADTLLQKTIASNGSVMLAAARVGGVRLIDNWVLGSDQPLLG